MALKPALEFYATIHEKLINENNTNVSNYAKIIEQQISDILETSTENIFYGLSNFEQSVDTFLMPDYLNALNLVTFKLKSLGYNANINFTSYITIKI